MSKDYNSRAHVQYNAIMLIRILADNPGPTFTRNIDSKFVSATKDLLRNSRDPSVQQLLRESIGALQSDKSYDTNLNALFQMWNKEQSGASSGPRSNSNGAMLPASGPLVGAPPSRRRGDKHLPAPQELASRIEEAKTSAKLLQQLVQSSAQSELQSNDLIKEFVDRCQSAQKSIQGYISADSPPPDDDTMQTLIETMELLSLALSKHSRALLQARRALGQTSPSPNNSGFPAPPAASAPNAAVSATYTPSGLSPTSAYSPPPLPPSSMLNALDRRPVPTHTYSPLPEPPHNDENDAPQQAHDPIYDNPFADTHEEPNPALPARPGTYNNPTASYVRRQDSAEENLTMHGGRTSQPISPERGAIGSDGHGGTKGVSGGEVSPIFPNSSHR
jgi:GAT domain